LNSLALQAAENPDEKDINALTSIDKTEEEDIVPENNRKKKQVTLTSSYFVIDTASVENYSRTKLEVFNMASDFQIKDGTIMFIRDITEQDLKRFKKTKVWNKGIYKEVA
jgi:hypothetical protein